MKDDLTKQVCFILPFILHPSEAASAVCRICCPPTPPRKGVGQGQERIQKPKEPTMTTTSYRAVQTSKPGRLEVVERELTAPPPGKVRIRVEACGVCHSDSGTIDGQFPIDWPRVPGHELVGRIDALGSGVQGWAVGQRVGVGFLAGACGYCDFCRRGELVNCRNQEYTGVHHDGGYAEVMIAKASGLVSIPDELS